MKKYCFLLYGLLILGVTNAQYTVLHNFNSIYGSPIGKLTLVGKELYGETYVVAYPATHYSGSIFSVDTNGNNFRVLHVFDSTPGDLEFSFCSLTYNAGVLYGMTSEGGTHYYGNIFSIDTSGNNYKDLFDLDSAHGEYPYGSLTLYGATLYGMTSMEAKYGAGNVFSIDTNGNGFKDLYDFAGGFGNGAQPYGSLTLSGNKLYGMTSLGGAVYGNIFSIDTNGNNYKDLFNFSGSGGDGNDPYGDLTLSGDVLYGMTPTGGFDGVGNIFSIDTNGNGFKDMLDFGGSNGPRYPYGSLIISGSRLYGGGTGKIFSIDTNGNGMKILCDLTISCTLFLSGSALYGTTESGGTGNSGIVFKIDTSAVASVNSIIEDKRTINVYPDPSNGSFTLSLLNLNNPCNVEIYNALGEKVYAKNLLQPQSNNSINLIGQPTGVYFYRVLSEHGRLVGEGKVDIQK